MQTPKIDITKEDEQYVDAMSVDKRIALINYLINESLGIVTVSEYIEISMEKNRTVYDHIEKEKIRSTNLLNQKVIIINS